MAEEPLITPVQLQRTQIDADRELLASYLEKRCVSEPVAIYE